MASYSIVLNISGNATTRAEKLAAALARADVSAKSLAMSLRAVGAAAQTVPVRTIRVSSAAPRATSVAPGREPSMYTRHRYTRVGSYGYGFSFGGFSARLSSIIQPDENGQLFGMDAAKLARTVNIAGIATNILASVGKALFKATAYTTIGSYAVGGIGTMMLTKFLMSEGMAEGVRILQRRNQARLGLGSAYLQAQSNADSLARDYGLDRSSAISAINVLSGMGVANTGSKLTINDATALTRVGGLISQQAGVSFERVMTNIQQLMVQSNPNIRDIRELLNQAPILGRYAIDEMERKGITGVDKNTYLKDQSNLLSILTRYDVENASSQIMQARGIVTVAQQDFYAKLATNKDWTSVAFSASKLLDSFGTALSNLISSLQNDTGFQNSINSLRNLIDYLSENTDEITRFTSNFANAMYATFGVDIANLNPKTVEDTQREKTIRTIAGRYMPEMLELYSKSGLARTDDPNIIRRRFFDFYHRLVDDQWLRDSDKLQAVNLLYNYRTRDEKFDILGDTKAYNTQKLLAASRYYDNLPDNRDYVLASGQDLTFSKRFTGLLPSPLSPSSPWYSYSESSSPKVASYLSKLSGDKVLGWFAEAIAQALKGATTLPNYGSAGGAGGASGGTGTEDDLRGFSRDRRSLVINFNDKLVEWNSTITTDDPQEVVDDVSQNINALVSAAIQKALLGATNSMNSRWY